MGRSNIVVGLAALFRDASIMPIGTGSPLLSSSSIITNPDAVVVVLSADAITSATEFVRG